jgi:glucosamine 6-phosphate synthetase-like amidotransferase/phosphosugar isomerase protein
MRCGASWRRAGSSTSIRRSLRRGVYRKAISPLAYHTVVLKGTEVDRPRNLTKKRQGSRESGEWG